MGFFFNDVSNKKNKKQQTTKVASKFGCSVCTLKELHNTTKNMKPSGSDEPLLYFLGEAVGATEDMENKHFIGESGQILRNVLDSLVDEYFIDKYIRWSYIVRCRPFVGKANRPPTQFEIDCCRTNLVKDIEKTKPAIIVGFGGIPLKTLTSGSQIGMWRGRLVPVKIGEHVCWYFPSYHPSFLLRNIEKKKYADEYDKCFKADLKYVIDFLFKDYTDPLFIESDYNEGITIITERNIPLIKKHLDKFREKEFVSLDIETNRIKPYYDNSKLLTIAIGTDEEVVVFPVEYPNFWGKQEDEVKDLLFDFLLNSGVKIAHNLKFELEWFYKKYNNQRLLRETEWGDTMLQAYLLDERTSKEEGMLNLNALTALHFGFSLKEKSSIDRSDLMKSELGEIMLYNGKDVKYTYKLFMKQKNLLTNGLINNYNKMIKTTISLAVLQNEGVFVDLDILEEFEKGFSSKMLNCEKEIKNLQEVKKFKEIGGKDLDIMSNDELIIVFRDILKYREVKQTKKAHKFALDDEVLSVYKIEYKSKLAKLVSEYRSLNKSKSTYIDNVRESIIKNKVHPDFHITGTVTGRFSSGKGNI